MVTRASASPRRAIYFVPPFLAMAAGISKGLSMLRMTVVVLLVMTAMIMIILRCVIIPSKVVLFINVANQLKARKVITPRRK